MRSTACTDAAALLTALQKLADDVDKLCFEAPVDYVYNPLRYAWSVHEEYVRRYARVGVPVLLLGMNPGPWGMAQTGVPFGEVSLVRDWLGLSGPIEKPAREHPKREVSGFSCARSEVSGARLWGWARQRFSVPERFFTRFFVANYCPLAFLETSSRNRTPDKLLAPERDQLYRACDRALLATVQWLRPQWVIGVGKFAESRAKVALADTKVSIGTVLHPSPASPVANRGWAAAAEKQLLDLGIVLD